MAVVVHHTLARDTDLVERRNLLQQFQEKYPVRFGSKNLSPLVPQIYPILERPIICPSRQSHKKSLTHQIQEYKYRPPSFPIEIYKLITNKIYCKKSLYCAYYLHSFLFKNNYLVNNNFKFTIKKRSNRN